MTGFRAMTLPGEGGCLCGALRFRIDKAPVMTAVCHCPGCQKMSASAFSTTVVVPAEGFAVTAGQSVLGARKRPDAQHHHCPECLAWVYTTFPAMPIVNVRATMLDDATWFAPFVETFISTRLPWATTPARHSFEEFPEPNSYQQLMADYAETLAREEPPHG